MTKKIVGKRILPLEPVFRDVLVCNENKTCPFIEIFIQEPENVSQQGLGILAGIFDITDNSEDSSYIVNYLISIIKKEYYSKPKRGPIESFESALHKGNLALSKLASHGNVNWIGHLNAICLVFEKNNIHFAQTGTAKAFLLRAKSMTDITEGGEFPGEPNPIKTFTEVSSGRIQLDDKIILTTDAIFEIFSFEEIKKSALRFPEKDFIQFLNTALVNELEKAGVLIVDVKEKKEKELADTPHQAETASYQNAFSQNSFKGKFQPTKTEEPPSPAKEGDFAPKPSKSSLENFMKEVETEVKKTNDGFVDEKTGHIYIKEDFSSPKKDGASFSEKFSVFREGISTASSNWIKSSKQSSSRGIQLLKSLEIKNKLLEKSSVAAQKLKSLQEARRQRTASREKTKKPINNIIIPALQGFLRSIGKNFRSLRIFILEKAVKPVAQKISTLSKKIRERKSSPNSQVPSYAPKENTLSSDVFRFKFSGLKKLKEIFLSLDYTKKIYALLAIFAIFVVPYFIANFKNKKIEEAPIAVETPEIPTPLENDKNVVQIKEISSIYNDPKVISVAILNNTAFAITKNQIISLSDNEIISIPESFSNPVWATEMDDLGLIFLISSDGKTLSFSPAAKKFQEGKLNFPDNSQISSIRSYMTYLYALDQKNNQIYRYFRSDASGNGFGEKTDWIKDKTDISTASSMAVSDNIFITANNSLLKFFRNKKANLALESSATPIVFDQVFTKSELENIYILDRTNSRIIEFSSDGNILAQYHNEAIGKANGFSVNEGENLVHIYDPEGVRSFEMK